MKKLLFFVVAFVSGSLFAQQKDTTSQFNKTKKMTEVVVKNKKSFVEIQVDKLVLNVQNDIIATAGTVFEILQRAPGVSISNDETINMSGKAGVNILIDGKPTQLSSKDLADYLKATPGSVVDKIEIIMNPSSRYDAQGNAGIINIRMKKNTIKGTNGSVSAAYTQSTHPNINFSANLNHRQGKWNWFTNASARKSRQNTNGTINRFVNSGGIEKTFNNKTVDQDYSKNSSFLTGVDYYLDKKNSFAFLVKGNEYWSKLYTPGNTLISTINITDSSLSTLRDYRNRTSRYNFSLNYKYEDTLGTEFNVDADYASYSNNSTGIITADLLNGQNVKYGYTANDQDVLTAIHIYSIKTDYTHYFKKAQAKIETGLKWNSIETGNNLRAFVWKGNAFLADTGRTNRFDYKETTHAVYASFNQKIKKWEYQLGLRAEQSVIKGKSIGLQSKQLNYPDTSYFNLFPAIFLRYTLNDKNILGLSYGRRINRPTYQDMNPFEFIYDNYSREKGNPYLLPEFSNNFEFTYSYRGALNIGAGYSQTNNFIQTIITQIGESAEATNYNIGSENRWYMNLSLGLPVTKWWNTYNNLSPHYKKFTGEIPGGKLDNTALGMNWYSSQTFTLPKKWKVQLSSWGSINTKDAMSTTSGLGSLDAGLSKSILKDKMNIRVAVTDILNTQKWQQVTDFGNVHLNYYRKWETQSVRVQLTWKFGKTNFKQRERTEGAETELNRIK